MAEGGQGALEIVHLKTDWPAGAKPVIVVTGDVGVVMVPGPEILVHKPVPTIGALAAITVDAVETQIV